MKKFVFLIIVFPLLLTAGITNSQNVNYKAQSLLIYLFTKNISWPSNAGTNNFVIGIYGNSPVYDELNVMSRIKKAGNGRTFEIRQISDLKDITEDMALLYICSSKSRDLKKISDKIGSKSTLIVAERDGLARKGAGINFIIMENNALRFEINQNKLLSQNLKPSSELLQQGFLVK